MKNEPSKSELAAEMGDLRIRLAEAEEALHGIRTGEVDAVVVGGKRGEQVYTLRGADRVYRQLIETMSEGAVTLSADGVILYGNACFAKMVGQPLEQVMGAALRNYLPPADQQALDAMVAQTRTEPTRREINLKSSDGHLVPVYVSASRLQNEDAEMVFCLVLTDLTEQKSHEQIVAAERLARIVLELAAEAIVVCDEQGRVIRVSQAAQRFCDDRPLLRPFAEVFPLRTDVSDPFELAPVMKGKMLRNVDVALHRQGQSFDFLLNAGPLLDGQQILGCVVTLTNITDSKRAERELAHRHQLIEAISNAEKRFIVNADAREAFDGLLLDMLALTGSEYGFIGEVLFSSTGEPYLKTKAMTNIAWNEATRAFYAGHAPEGMEFRNLRTLFGAALTSGEPVIANEPGLDPRRAGMPEGHPPIHAFLGVPVQTGNGLVAMVGIANRRGGYDQSVIDFLHPLLTTIGQLVEARRNLTERQRAEEQLRESETRLGDILSSTADWVWEVDEKGVYTYTSAKGLELLGDVIGKTPFDFMPPDEARRVAPMLSGIVQNKAPIKDLENWNIRKNGERICLLTNGVPILDDAGNLKGYRGVDKDITGRKLAEETLKKQVEELQRWHEVTLGRETRVVELKREVNELLGKGGQPPRYDSVARGKEVTSER